MGAAPGPYLQWPGETVWYLLARHAVVGLLQVLPRRSRRLWVPSYFCFDVSAYWTRLVDVVTYRDDPRRSEPEWPSLRPGPDDLVIAVNYFGTRDGSPWEHYRQHNECVLVEDHSHDPASEWALHSKADYCFASLRKTLPVPDGGILWSPPGLALPSQDSGDASASSTKLAAMVWKREYLSGNVPPESKTDFRQWQAEGERRFDQADTAFATDLTREYLKSGVPAVWRQRRSDNTQHLLSVLAGKDFHPIFSRWPEAAVPLGLVLEFQSPARRDAIRQYLQQHDVYCPVHWPPLPGSDQNSAELAARLLTIPTDFRYSREDMEKIAATLANV